MVIKRQSAKIMIVRYAKLTKNWLLRGWSDAPLTVVNWVTGDVRPLTKKGFYVAGACDGNTNFVSLAYLPEHHAILDELIKAGIAEACQEGNSIEYLQQYRKAENPRLIGIHWCVTGLCNLNCRHCYMESPSGKYGELPFESMVRLIGQFERANVLEISFTGGEPFLRQDILDIFGLLAEKKIHLGQIFSNGLLITWDHLNSIKRIGFSPGFQISFDGVGAHDYMRGTNGIEASVIDAIRKIRVAGFNVVVATSIDRINVSRLNDTYELMKELDVQSWRIASPQEVGNWRGTTTALSIGEKVEAYSALLDRWLKDGRPFYIQLDVFFRGGKKPKKELPTDEKTIGDVGPEYTQESFDCGAIRVRANLLPDGTLVPCTGYVDTTMQERMPNLLNKDLSKVWTESCLREIADMKKKDLLEKNPECAVCEHFKQCGIGCRASALTETGDLMAKDPIACEMWKNGYKKRFEELAMAATNK